MKRIVISDENIPTVLFDDDKRSLEEYCVDVEKLFASNNIVTLHCTSGSVVLRPSKITKILVDHCVQSSSSSSSEEKNMTIPTKPKPIEKRKEQEVEDMIIEA